MLTQVPFSVRLEGGFADNHELPAYDGYTALAGFALSLSLITNYVETGKIRRRGHFVGRNAVKASAIMQGSVLSEFSVELAEICVLTAGVAISGALGREFFYDIFKRTIDRNLGIVPQLRTQELRNLEEKRGGDLEALVAATEPSIRQAHSVIGEGAQIINVFGGPQIISKFNPKTKEYVDGTIMENKIHEKDVSVASFNVNSGYGGVYDGDLGRIVPIKVNRNTLSRAKTVLTWGIDQYAKGTGKLVVLRYYRVLALDDTVKSYIVIDAEIPEGSQ